MYSSINSYHEMGSMGCIYFLSADYAWNYEHHFCTSVKTFNTIFEILKLLTVKNDVIWKVVNYLFSECVHTSAAVKLIYPILPNILISFSEEVLFKFTNLQIFPGFTKA